ncbi:MAG: CheR family methyltransferase [Cellulosilyticaceae bacterium]
MDYTQFKEVFFKLSAIDLSAYKENQMKRRIDAMIRKQQCQGYSDFIDLIKKDKERYEEFMNYLTINVSEFFRNPIQWQTLEQEIIPSLLKKKRSIKVWSAACSTGDEPYSLVMLLSKFMPLSQIQVLATDIDKEILARARKGQYIDKYIENVPEAFKTKYFNKKDTIYEVSEDIKKCVTFKEHNLLKDPYPQNIDLIVCRNVLIYFTEEAKNTIYTKFSEALTSEGVLFVGSTEQIIGAQKYGLAPCRVFFYQKQ